MASPSVILGISTDSRSVGLAVLRDGELIDWRVKTFRGLWSKEKLAYILRRLESAIEYYRATAVAVLKTDAMKESKQQKLFAHQLALLAKRKRLRMRAYSIHDMRRVSGDRYRSPRKNVADFILDKYPVLRHQYLKERNNKQQYYFRMFDAVLCAHLCAQDTKLDS